MLKVTTPFTQSPYHASWALLNVADEPPIGKVSGLARPVMLALRALHEPMAVGEHEVSE